MTPRQNAVKQAKELEAALGGKTLSFEKRQELEQELNAIIDNLAEGCYSNDPDDGIDWSDCPGIYTGRKSPNKTYNLKFICPPMSYKLYYKNDQGVTTYDDYIPPDLIPQYREKVAEALKQDYFIQINHPSVIGANPEVEIFDGEMHGVVNVTLKDELLSDQVRELCNNLDDLVSGWSIYFESNKIETDGGNLYIRFHNSPEPIMTETAFNNLAFVSRNSADFDSIRFYTNESSVYISMVYYNPDSSAGGQLVQNDLYLDILEEAFDECKTEDEFWDRLDERARQYLTDIDSHYFADEARSFVENPCDYSRQNRQTMDAIKSWAAQQRTDIGRTQGMNML